MNKNQSNKMQLIPVSTDEQPTELSTPHIEGTIRNVDQVVQSTIANVNKSVEVLEKMFAGSSGDFEISLPITFQVSPDGTQVLSIQYRIAGSKE